MANRLSKSYIRVNINLLKEVGYILLLITFFVGILIGAFSFKNVADSNFQQYEDVLKKDLIDMQENNEDFSENSFLIQGIKIICLFWIIGMSVVGTPVLIGYVGYKGFSIGYTISTVIKVLGTVNGNRFIFENLFLHNLVIVFIMIFLANYSIKICRNFFESKENIKVDIIKYTIVSTFMAVVYIAFGLILRIIR